MSTSIKSTKAALASLGTFTPLWLIGLLICALNSGTLFAQPANDLCADAQQLVFNGSDLTESTGSNTTATTTGAPQDCGAAVNNSDVGGVWYTFTGTGANQMYTISTCSSDTDYDTEISVYSGTCGSLVCLAGDDNDPYCNNTVNIAGNLKSTVNLISQGAEQYYIYVNGNNGASGNFGIFVVNQTHLRNSQDECINAINLNFASGSLTGIFPNLQYATSADAPQDCGADVNNGDSEGTWYTFTGTGAGILYNISTCHPFTNFDTEISAFTGSCGNLTCIDGNDDNGACFGGRSSFDIVTDAIEPYYIYAKGNEGAGGNFGLLIENQTHRIPPNDLCENAIVIPTPIDNDGLRENGVLEFATTRDAPPDCGENVDNDNSGGIWYTFTALENRQYWITTCPIGPSSFPGFDTEISVWTGTCGSLTCVTGSDDLPFCPNGSPPIPYYSGIPFFLYNTMDTQYYIYLKGEAGATGSFEILLADASPEPAPDDDICNDGPTEIPLMLHGGSSSGSSTTRFATDSDAPADCGAGVNNSDAAGVWVEFTGTGNRLYEVTTCNAGTVIDTEVSAFSGPCNNLTCIDGNADDPTCSVGSGRSTFTFSPVSTPPSSLVLTRFYVKGAQFNFGEFTLQINDLSPINDACYNAENIDVFPGGMGFASGDLENASTVEAPVDCGTNVNNSDSGGVWYTFTGNNNRTFLISTCSANTGFDTEASVFSGSCGSFTCVEGNDDDGTCSTGGGTTSSSLMFTASEATTQYYVYVKGNGGASGTFDISIEDLTPENDLCDNAIALADPSPGGSVSVSGTLNQYATILGAESSCDPDVDNFDSGGIWYTFTAETSETFEITTCNPGTNFDTEISLFASTSCGGPIPFCEGNDDDGICSEGNGSSLSTITWTNNSNISFVAVKIYVKGNGGATGDFTLRVNNLGVLPVELTSFTGREVGPVNQLEWKTASESNTQWHVIERSLDGRDWQEVNRVAAAGESNIERYYSLQDKAPLPSAFYRLQSIDFDGSFSLSRVIHIERESNANFAIVNIFPMPVDDLMNVTFLSRAEETLTLSIYDIHGRLLRNEVINALAGENQTQIDLQDLPDGAYMLSLTGNKEQVAQRILKTRK